MLSQINSENYLIWFAERRPDLLQRSLCAERDRSSVEIELVLKETMRELEAIARDTPGMQVPYVFNLRFNHSTRKIHAGHSHRWTYLFSEAQTDPLPPPDPFDGK